jgi:hypothetical protein
MKIGYINFSNFQTRARDEITEHRPQAGAAEGGRRKTEEGEGESPKNEERREQQQQQQQQAAAAGPRAGTVSRI